jgi:hypothetical protein
MKKKYHTEKKKYYYNNFSSFLKPEKNTTDHSPVAAADISRRAQVQKQ